MRNYTILFLFLLSCWNANSQQLSFKYFDAQTGKAIQPHSLIIENTQDSYHITEQELNSSKLLKNKLTEGQYELSIAATGYKTMISPISIKKNQATQRSFYMRNLNPPHNISADYVKSQHRSDGTIIVGYIVDDHGIALPNTEIRSNDGEHTTTNKEGYFTLFLKLQDVDKSFSIKSLTISQADFKTDIREKIVVYPNGDYIFKFILEKGSGIKTTAMSDIIVEHDRITGRHKDINQPYFESTDVHEKKTTSFNCDDIPNSITVGYSNINDNESTCTTNCPNWITIDFEMYVRESLDNEWLNLWSTLPNIHHAYRAGAVGIRSFAGWRAVVNPRTSNYDITNNTKDQAYSPGTTSWAMAAQIATEGSVMKSSSTGQFISTNYAAETNNSTRGPCGDGFFQNSVGANQCYADAVTEGYPNLGHPWNMGQWQSARWATGLNLEQNYSFNNGSSHGYGSKTWQWILNHYYPSHSLFNCDNPTSGVFDCTTAVNLTCGLTYSGPSSNAASTVSKYGCNNWTETGPERVHKITSPGSGTLTASLTNFTGDLDVYILASCDPSDCVGTVSSSSASFTEAQIGQVYYIVVDADDGSGSSYDLTVTCPSSSLNCSSAIPLTCGTTYSGSSSSAASLVYQYGCNDWTESGPERIHEITPQGNGLLTASLSAFSGDLDVYILGSCDPTDCLGSVSGNSASFNNAVAGTTYYIVVDADDGSGSAYNLIVDCPEPAGLNCSNAVNLTCGINYIGSSSIKPSSIDSYGCNNWSETGPERVHKITPTRSGQLTASLSNFSGDLDVYILGSCDPDDCLGTVSSNSASYDNAVAGTTYYIVVDADDGSGSAYHLIVDCPEPAGLDCDNAVSLTCGVNYIGSSSSNQSEVDTYGCNSWTETGPERIHKITPLRNGTLTATLSNFTGDLDVYILGSCDPTDCLGTVFSQSASFDNAIAGTTYYIVVDADDGSGSGYDLIVDCPQPAGLDCSQAVSLTCGVSYIGQSSTSPSEVDVYGCNNWIETGPERVHIITPEENGTLTASIFNFTGDLDVYILGSCDPNDCLATDAGHSTSIPDAIADRTYYIIVDAFDGSGSAYELLVDCPQAVSECPPILSINTPISSGVYDASIQVNAASVITTGSDVLFRAGNNVLLNEDFEVTQGAAFEAVIDNCQNFILPRQKITSQN